MHHGVVGDSSLPWWGIRVLLEVLAHLRHDPRLLKGSTHSVLCVTESQDIH